MSQLLSRFVARAGNPRIAIIDGEGDHSYASLVSRAMALRVDVAPGERVGLLAGPGADFVAGFFGILLSGGTVVVLSPLHPLAETRYFCDDAGVRVVLATEELRSLAPADRDVRDLKTELAKEPASKPLPDDTAPALQLYTSGTTGKPKGAVLSHRNIAIQQEVVGEAWGFSESDTLLHALPLHHMHGLAIALLTALGAGATIRMRTFDAVALWEEMASATVFMGVPAMYHRLFAAFDAASDADRERWSRNAKELRLATSGSAAMPVTLAERWRALTGVIPLERFGMTEIGVGISNVLHGERFPGHVGFPLRTVETQIVDGELWIRGPSVFIGYHNKPKETEAVFVPDPGGAWFRTGDTVARAESLAGAPFKILGRTSVDILKSGGYKLSALEIEEVLREHEAVSEVAVVGVPDEAWGERVVACVIAREGMSCDEATLRAFARERLAPYKVPKNVHFVAQLPKNALGKVVKPELVRQLKASAPEA